MQRKAGFVGFLLISIAMASCSAASDTSSNSACSSGMAWNGGNKGSEFMNPGMDCVGCHQANQAPKLAVAGTVYTSGTDLDLCTGNAGAVIEITDANKVVTNFTSNQLGNFYGRNNTFAMPYTARITLNGKERKMLSPQTSVACNSCHTASGLNGAPGRILLP